MTNNAIKVPNELLKTSSKHFVELLGKIKTDYENLIRKKEIKEILDDELGFPEMISITLSVFLKMHLSVLNEEEQKQEIDNIMNFVGVLEIEKKESANEPEQ